MRCTFRTKVGSRGQKREEGLSAHIWYTPCLVAILSFLLYGVKMWSIHVKASLVTERLVAVADTSNRTTYLMPLQGYIHGHYGLFWAPFFFSLSDLDIEWVGGNNR